MALSLSVSLIVIQPLKSYSYMYIFPQTLSVDTEVVQFFYYTNDKTYLPKAFTRATIS